MQLGEEEGRERGRYFCEDLLLFELLQFWDGLLQVEAGFVGHCCRLWWVWWGELWWGGVDVLRLWNLFSSNMHADSACTNRD